ncbi:MAG TPA: heavy-metal-associated domain-containing protein [Syntrophomonadaceae bacterium]|nr:heavy-metal-associated domain-containing protein [Syntrophomonadaceae bacterium]
METIKVLGVDCNNCAAHVQNALKDVKGIQEIDIRLPEKIALVTFDPNQVAKKDIADRVEDFGYDVE